MSMLGLRDLVLIAPTPSLHQGQPISAEHTSNLPLPSSASLSVGFGIFPLLTATPCMPQPHQNNEVQDCGGSNNNNNNYWNLKMCPEVNPSKKGVINVDDDDENHHKVVMENEENGVYGADFRVCQDCGNRAKKDCIFRRCRTCCKGRGYDCNTHVKSTWVPSIRRREREMAVAAGGAGAKRPRAIVGSSQNATATSHSSNSNATTPKSLATSSPHQDAGFKQSLPGHVRAPAVFRCHRVSAIGNGEDEFAYLATVHISGHVFKGFLYDHGVDGKNSNAVPCVSELQLGNNCSGKNRECSSIGVPTNNAYPASAS
ncbi:protein LATERAL ROOT PRIMORDIUM 1-like [Abrus precatorius]|uniref:Protein LATERAL ROOT PRIMORDIUM 1-like n=1 Tax=Abrus precatorius TaxID=3816 RepID=A0A8B8KGY0_ABRPR|nr:protein LATERAL ROOT PRIMORDIUM 1-like [Abrus precatorius]